MAHLCIFLLLPRHTENRNSQALALKWGMRLDPAHEMWAEEGPWKARQQSLLLPQKPRVEMVEPRERKKLNPCVGTLRAHFAWTWTFTWEAAGLLDFTCSFSTAWTKLTDTAPTPRGSTGSLGDLDVFSVTWAHGMFLLVEGIWSMRCGDTGLLSGWPEFTGCL